MLIAFFPKIQFGNTTLKHLLLFTSSKVEDIVLLFYSNLSENTRSVDERLIFGERRLNFHDSFIGNSPLKLGNPDNKPDL